MKVIELQSSSEDAYQSFVNARRDALIYHTLEYRDLLTEITEGVARYFLCEDDKGIVRGILPLFQIDGPHGFVLNSLPYYGSNGGIVSETDAARNALMSKYNDLVAAKGVAASTIIANPFNEDALANASHDYVDSRIGQVSPIDAAADHEDVLMDRFHYKTRNMIRKAIKSGVTVTADNSLIGQLREIHEENMNALGGKPKTPEFFEAMASLFAPRQQYRIYVACLDGKIAAALLLFFHGEVVEYFTPAVRKEYRDSQALSLTIFTAMVDASRAGFRWWNWGGTWSSQESLHRFKSRWGTQDRPYVYRTKVNDSSLIDASSKQLLIDYPYAYVMPFSALRAGITS